MKILNTKSSLQFHKFCGKKTADDLIKTDLKLIWRAVIFELGLFGLMSLFFLVYTNFPLPLISCLILQIHQGME